VAINAEVLDQDQVAATGVVLRVDDPAPVQLLCGDEDP